MRPPPPPVERTKVWDRNAGSEFGFLYTGDKGVVFDEEIVYLLTRVFNAFCIELEKMGLDLVGRATQRGGG